MEKLTINEQKLRDLYLRNIAIGKLQGPMVGKASIDKPWLKNYSEDAIKSNAVKKTLYQRIRDVAVMNPNKIAIRYFNTKIKYSDFISKVDEVADALCAQGIKKGDTVTICLPNVPEYAYVKYALNKIGAVSDWIDFRTGLDELVSCLDDVNSKMAITFDGLNEKVNEAINIHNTHTNNKVSKIIKVSATDSMPLGISNISGIVNNIKKKKNDNDVNEISWYNFMINGRKSGVKSAINPYKENDTAVIVYTGGTTGTPKGVALTNDNFNASVDGYDMSNIDFKLGDTFLNFLPPWTAYGLSTALYIPLCLGVESILIPKLDPATFDKLLLKYKPNHITGIPKNWDILRESKNVKNKNLSFLKTAACGADTMNPNIEKENNKFFAKHGSNISIIKGYGMTELCASGLTTSNDINKFGSVGIPLVKNNIMVIDEDENELNYGSIGEICISGPSVMKEYNKNPKATKEVLFVKNNNVWMKTGDLGYVDKDGFAYIVDRKKRMFARSGFKIFTTVIEEVVGSHYAVEACAAVGIKNHVEGKTPYVQIVLKDEYKNNSNILKEIDDLCKQKLFEYYFPMDYDIVDSIPYTKNGKVDFIKIESSKEKMKTV